VSDLRAAVLFGDLEDDLGVVPIVLVVDEVEIVAQNAPCRLPAGTSP
jgi:hypothetical protein